MSDQRCKLISFEDLSKSSSINFCRSHQANSFNQIQQVNYQLSSSFDIVSLKQPQEQLFKQTPNVNLQPCQKLIAFNGILLEDEQSPYWSDSTLSNCDRDTADNKKTLDNQHKPLHDEHNREIIQNNLDGQSEELDSCGGSSAARLNQRRGNTIPGPARVVRKRVMANERERERTKSLNQALEILRDRLPIDETHKRSKIQTLRLAKDYIEFLRSECKSTSSQFQEQSNNNDNAQPYLSTAGLSITNGQYTSCDCGNHKPHRSCGLDNSFKQSSVAGANFDRRQPEIQTLTYKFYKFRLEKQARTD